MRKLGLAVFLLGLLLTGCSPGPSDSGLHFYAPDDPTVAIRAYAPYDNYYGRYYGRRGGTPTE
jgi:hypothetical protein